MINYNLKRNIYNILMKIVAARYNEDVSWSEKFPNVIIYNKGTALEKRSDGNNYNEVFLDNVGREGHTYYKYICDNYDNLDDYTIFLQGHPYDHNFQIDNFINKYINDPNLDFDFEFLSSNVLNCNLSGCYYHKNLPLIEVYEKLFDIRKTEMSFQFSPGAQFIVSKKQILKRPKDFYLKIVELLGYTVHPIEGNVIERFHKIIFS